MSETISLELSDFDAALLSELSKREAKTPEELFWKLCIACSPAVLMTRSFLFHLMYSTHAPK